MQNVIEATGRDGRRRAGTPEAGGVRARRTEDGMVPADVWASTQVAQASRISCGGCGEAFPTSQAFYAHADAGCKGLETRKRRKAVDK